MTTDGISLGAPRDYSYRRVKTPHAVQDEKRLEDSGESLRRFGEAGSSGYSGESVGNSHGRGSGMSTITVPENEFNRLRERVLELEADKARLGELDCDSWVDIGFEWARDHDLSLSFAYMHDLATRIQVRIAKSQETPP